MTGNVVDFKNNKPTEEEFTLSDSHMRCLNCAHEWIQDIEVGASYGYKCPKCLMQKGITTVLYDHADGRAVCNCGCDLFSIAIEDGALCPMCIRCGSALKFTFS